MTTNSNIELTNYLKELKLPTMRQYFQPFAQRAEADRLPYERYLLELAEREYEARRNNTIERFLRESQLPREKTLDSFDFQRLPAATTKQFKALLDGAFLDRKENVLAFGNPGTGKTHLMCALSQELIRKGRRVYFAKCTLLVQMLLKAKADLRLAKTLKSLARFEAILIDDIGYVHQNKDEIEVLFTLLAERYERASVLITSNLAFSQWDSIFKDQMMTAAAIDRLIHHSVILELNIPSYRMEQAKTKLNKEQSLKK